MKTFFRTLVIALFLFSCDKKEEGPSNPPSPPSPPSCEPYCDTYDVDLNGIPKFIQAHHMNIDVDTVPQISKFRSGVGHNYSDDFESCRSMKHYFQVQQGAKIYSPISGTVSFLQQEWTGYKVQIKSSNYPAFFVEIFHVSLSSSLSVGTNVSAGQLLGTHSSSSTYSDIAILVITNKDGPNNVSYISSGWKYISYFEAMPDSLFSKYQSRGINHRDSLVISKADRNNDPLTCDFAGTFTGGNGNLNNWTTVNY